MLPVRNFYLTYTSDIIDMFTNSIDRPYPIFISNQIGDFITTHYPFKGILIIESHKYYSGALIRQISNQINVVQHVGFFITYEFSNIDYSRLPELRFSLVYSFDYNPDIDHYGGMTIKLIDWFVNKHNDRFRNYIVDECKFIFLFKYITKPIYSLEGGIKSFIRRSVVFEAKAIKC